MIQGLCIDTGDTVSLEKGKKYFLFPNGKSHYYVSNFPSQNAHKGCFQAVYFKPVTEEEFSSEPEGPKLIKNFDPERVYKATLVWRKPGYKSTKLKEYYLRLNSDHLGGKVKLIDHCYFYEGYENGQYTGFCGCFPLHWFSNIKEVQQEQFIHNEQKELEMVEPEKTLDDIELEYTICEQLTLF